MTRSGAYLGFISAISLLIILAGCAVFSDEPEPTTPDENDLLFAPNLVDEAVVDPLPLAEASPQPVVGSPQEDMETKMGLREQRVRALVQNFNQEGKKFIEKGMYEQAQEQFAHALEPGSYKLTVQDEEGFIRTVSFRAFKKDKKKL